MFTTEAGIASLALKEIPYKGEAYVRIRDVQPGKLPELLSECISFCRMVEAESVYAADIAELGLYPLHAAVLEMRGLVRFEAEDLDNLFPVTDETVSRWRRICNERLYNVDCAATLTAADEKEILSSGGAYFIHRDGELLGTGWIKDGKLLLICSVKPGAGERVLRTLASVNQDEQIVLEVASTNERAIRLYERLGFIKTKELSKWYKIF